MRLLFFILFCSFHSLAHGQHDSVNTKQLQEVMLTTQRVPKNSIAIPYAIQKTAVNYFKDYQPRTVPESLQGMSGVFVQKTNHGGGSAFIRGLTGNQTLMLIDGIRLNNATYRYGPNQYLNTIDPFLIDNIEVAKGTGSVQYGTDAIGGVIQLFSKDVGFSEKKKITGSAITKYMTGDMEKTARAAVNYSSSKVAFTTGVSVRKFGDLIGGDSTGKQTPSGYDEWSLNAKAKMLLSKKMTLTLSHQQLTQTDVPLYHRVQLENFAVAQFDLQQSQLQYARLMINTSNLVFKDVIITASHQQSKEMRTNRRNNAVIQREEFDQVNTAAFTLQANARFAKNWSATSGIELYRDKVKSEATESNRQQNSTLQKRGLYPDAASYGNYSVFTLHHFTRNRFSLDAGLRLNSFSIILADTSLGEVKLFPVAFVYNTALNYAIHKNHYLYANYSTGYRAPNIDDMGTLGIVDFRYEVPANNLRPEKSVNMELGYKFRTKKLLGDFSLFYMKLKDLITRLKSEGEIINGYAVYRKENIERAIIKGVEASLTWLPVRQLNFNANIAYNYGHNLSRQEALRRIPPLHGKLAGTYKNKQFFYSAEWLYAAKQNRLSQGDKDDIRIPTGGTPGWNVLNIYAGYQHKQVQINAGLQNIFNVDYRTHGSGINGVGRSVWVSIGVNL